MKPLKKLVRNALLGALACLSLVMVTPAVGTAVSSQPHSFVSTHSADSLEGSLTANLQAAESVLLAQGMTNGMMTSYVAILSKNNVVPTSPMTEARGTVGAVLMGDRLVVRGSFRNLSSPMRDYATDPVDPPNPNITSAFHIHRGEPTANGPFQYALQVMMDDTGRGGMAMGEYTLTPEQLQALSAGQLYLDLHTTQNRAGELRGILMPAA
ncbi:MULTISPECIES: CHRD domain-containing protein [unclassified Leptolyngbya]|uniref:CHRD domain-containing protein n=1 Tax=unclassified Leptolyngbya TaxID=2650499 RepID=UPI001683A58A|nr:MULTISPECIES: CHRD domain-containing protein [unclassified Leptolyngbya]MBD1913424.1 CHRD domain-containing protein [Leptolyngbya sp. FACHB-8]MBD2155819.1 CHRD domain-containing protein [Leptolyngbya sp. FACHB-16]